MIAHMHPGGHPYIIAQPSMTLDTRSHRKDSFLKCGFMHARCLLWPFVTCRPLLLPRVHRMAMGRQEENPICINTLNCNCSDGRSHEQLGRFAICGGHARPWNKTGAQENADRHGWHLCVPYTVNTGRWPQTKSDGSAALIISCLTVLSGTQVLTAYLNALQMSSEKQTASRIPNSPERGQGPWLPRRSVAGTASPA